MSGKASRTEEEEWNQTKLNNKMWGDRGYEQERIWKLLKSHRIHYGLITILNIRLNLPE